MKIEKSWKGIIDYNNAVLKCRTKRELIELTRKTFNEKAVNDLKRS